MNAATPPAVADARSTGGRLIYAIGDIHGRYDLLTALLADIVADSRGRSPAGPPVLVFLGDYVDRGPHSAKVVEAVLQLQGREGFEVHALKGNHEAALLDFLADPVAAPEWLQFGGVETLISYGVPAEALETGDLEALRDAFLARLPLRHQTLLEALELTFTAGDYLFVHAGVRPDIPLADQDEDDLLWIRRDFLAASAPFEKVVVHGHTPDPEPQLMHNRLGIDTGAYATGVLTAARLTDGEVALLQTGRAPAEPAAVATGLVFPPLQP
jgi:serine/threonine protein phosphatase 1